MHIPGEGRNTQNILSSTNPSRRDDCKSFEGAVHTTFSTIDKKEVDEKIGLFINNNLDWVFSEELSIETRKEITGLVQRLPSSEKIALIGKFRERIRDFFSSNNEQLKPDYQFAIIHQAAMIGDESTAIPAEIDEL